MKKPKKWSLEWWEQFFKKMEEDRMVKEGKWHYVLEDDDTTVTLVKKPLNQKRNPRTNLPE